MQIQIPFTFECRQVATLPETLKDESAWFDAEEGVLGGSLVEARRLGVGEERVRPTVTFPERVRPPDLVDRPSGRPRRYRPTDRVSAPARARLRRRPDLVEHLVADAQLLVAVVEPKSFVVPLLPEVEIQREILPRPHPQRSVHISHLI